LLEFHVVSDHIFLAATMLISLHTEVVCLMADLLRVEHRIADQPAQQQDSLTLSEVLLTLLLVLALFLYLFTAADMYFTAKYYHFPLVSTRMAGLSGAWYCHAWLSRLGVEWGAISG
jgi:hypothetical protein